MVTDASLLGAQESGTATRAHLSRSAFDSVTACAKNEHRQPKETPTTADLVCGCGRLAEGGEQCDMPCFWPCCCQHHLCGPCRSKFPRPRPPAPRPRPAPPCSSGSSYPKPSNSTRRGSRRARLASSSAG